MNFVTTAKLIIEQLPYIADTLYEYVVLPELSEVLSEGNVVTVPFGRADRIVRAIVFEISQSEKDTSKLKKINTIILNHTFSEDDLELIKYIRDRCFCTWFESAKTIMPAGILGFFEQSYILIESDKSKIDDDVLFDYFKKNNDKITRKQLETDLSSKYIPKIFKLIKSGYVVQQTEMKNNVTDKTQKILSVENEETASEYLLTHMSNKKHRDVIEFLLENGVSTAKETVYMTGCGDSAIKTLIKNGIIQSAEEKIYRNPLEQYVEDKNPQKIELNDEQQKAFNEISEKLNTGSTHLLHGVTGSGKTHVYMSLVDKVLSQGKQALILIPEISLTFQIVEKFYARYGKNLAVLHSVLSVGERFDEYNRIKTGDANVVVGTRSAVFAPMENIGIIIIDEEQEYTYKSEMTPKYHARDIAAFKVARSKSLLILASATPSFESFYRAKSGNIGYSEIKKRFNQQKLPNVIITDLHKEMMMGNKSIISNDFALELNKNLRNDEQTIIFLNRRGYNSVVTCTDCKNVIKCPNCGIALSYHSANNRLLCHYCSYTISAGHQCPDCGGEVFRYSGAGTQKIEEELKKLFPGTKILRMDGDTVNGKYTRDKFLTAFKNNEYNILLGTQMIAKGLDFPNVTLVGVLQADMSLYASDFKSYERTFSLITQVIGRAGRSDKSGRAVVQTYSPNHRILNFAFAQDYHGFYEDEIALRKTLIYPPFCDICQVTLLNDSEKKSFDSADKFIDLIKNYVETDFCGIPVKIIKPKATSIPKIGGRFRVRILIKCKDTQKFRKMLHLSMHSFNSDKEHKDVYISADINPAVIF